MKKVILFIGLSVLLLACKSHRKCNTCPTWSSHQQEINEEVGNS